MYFRDRHDAEVTGLAVIDSPPLCSERPFRPKFETVTAPTSASWRWTRWPLARQLPLLTALIVGLVMALTLTLTYRALVQAKSDAIHARLSGLMRPLVQSGEASSRLRRVQLEKLAHDSALIRALRSFESTGTVPKETEVARLLATLPAPADSGLPVELWTTNGKRVAHVGVDAKGDSVAALAPELRPLHGRPESQVPNGDPGLDSARMGALYPANGRVFLWAVAPVFDGKNRIGYLAQQRRISAQPSTREVIRNLFGEEVTVYLRNTTDNFWSTLDGAPTAGPTRRDTTKDGFVAYRPGMEAQIGTEGVVSGTPYAFILEVPVSALVSEPRATLRRILAVSLLLLFGAAVVAWAVGRRITRPLVDLTTAAEAIAKGDYGRRADTAAAMSDEVLRLGTSFNRMASEVEASQHELASQVEEATSVSEELERTNAQLQETSTEAEHARDEALQANRAKSDFLAVMSHELRTPLNAIGGYTEILQMGIYGSVNDTQKDALLRIARSQQTLLALINDVLNFAKLEAGEVSYSITDVVVGPALATLEELIAPQLRDRSMSYTVHPVDESLTVSADPDKLQQILINLLSNAIKYSANGGRIDVRCEAEATMVNIRVSDTGIGIAEERLEKIFDPFIQVGRALNRPHEGVGLGLSISRDLASGMKGNLSVQSEVGKGSTFTLALERGKDWIARS